MTSYRSIFRDGLFAGQAGIVTGSSVVCPLHAWKVNLADGCVERPSSEKERCIETYPVRVEEGVVVVAVPCTAPEEQVA